MREPQRRGPAGLAAIRGALPRYAPVAPLRRRFDHAASMASLKEVGARLYQRRHKGVIVPVVNCSIGSWRPIKHICHINVAWWVANHPNHQAVHGWMIFDFNAETHGLTRKCRFSPHSVVEDERHQLFDITPSGMSRPYPFIRHEGAAEDFVTIVAGNRLPFFDYWISEIPASAACAACRSPEGRGRRRCFAD